MPRLLNLAVYVYIMQTVGEILQKKRLEQKLTLDDVEREIRIRKKYLTALEADSFDRLPGTAYIIGFLKNYSRFLNLDSQTILALFRREYDEKRRLNVLPKAMVRPLGRPFVALTPRFFAIVTGILLLFIFLGYLLFEFRFAVGAPTLAIDSPQNNLVIKEDKVAIRGRTDPDVSVTINNGKIALQVDGSFSQEVSVLPGVNTYEISAVNKFGKKTTMVVVVEYVTQ